MRKLHEILRLHFDNKLTARAIARSCRLSSSTVNGYLHRAEVAKLSWPLPPDVDDIALTRLLFPNERKPVRHRPEPDYAIIHQELKQKHVTKQLLWQEYRDQHPDGYQYSQFCERYATWSSTLSVTMRQVHRAGEKMFVDFSGDGIDIINPQTGEVRCAKLFVAVLGASNLTYVEPVLSEDLPTWVGCHVRAYAYFGGVSEITVPDNLRSGVTRADFYDPDLNPTYADLARHYGTAVIPARKKKPRDKAKVEQGVLLAERWVLAVLRHRQFSTFAELRDAVRPLVERINTKPMKKIGRSRREVFENIERAALKPLPSTPYEMCEWKKASVNIDYHVAFDDHYYSVHYSHAMANRRIVEIRATETTVEILYAGHRIASHVRSYEKHKHTTVPEHMPESHRRYLEWTPSRLIAWAQQVGPNAARVVEEIMHRRPHPEQGFRACLGIMRLRETYSDSRIERACARAVRYRAYSRQSVLSILKNNLDGVPEEQPVEQMPLPLHDNLRGPQYFN